MAVGTGLLLQEALDTFHSALVLDLGEGVEHGVHSTVVGEVQLRELVGALGLVKDVSLLGRSVVDDLLLPVREVAKRHIRSHAHLAAHVHHKRPHQALPGSHRPLLYRERVIWYQCGPVDGPDDAGAAAGPAGSAAVERQILGPRSEEANPAHGAHHLLLQSHGHRGLVVMAVGTAMACKAGEHQAKRIE